MTNERPPILSIVRFVAVLREIGSNGPLSMAQTAKVTGIPYSTTRRIMQTMLGHRLIEHVPHARAYRLAATAFGLSAGAASSEARATRH